ncbi:MAG: glycosyltransferase family 2 protein [Pseudohongiellaceae bacterium]
MSGKAPDEEQQSRLTVSVSIVSYRSPPEELGESLDSLAGSLRQLKAGYPGSRAQVSLIDNNEGESLWPESMVPAREALSRIGSTLQLIHGHGNVGYGRGHNLAIRRATSQYHLILNPDVVMEESCLRSGIDYLEANPGVAMVSPFAQSRDGSRQYLCKRHPSVLDFLVRGFLPAVFHRPFKGGLSRYEMHELGEEVATTGIPIISGCFMLCRTANLQELGGFDDNYFMYFEDFDLSLRMGKTGAIAYVPAMRIRHLGGNSAKKGFRHIAMFVRSGFRYFNTWGWRFIQ